MVIITFIYLTEIHFGPLRMVVFPTNFDDGYTMEFSDYHDRVSI